MSHDGAYVARASAPAPLPSGGGNNGHDGSLSSTAAANDFARAPQYGSQDGFSSGGATSAGAPHHWSHQPSPYGASPGYSANQFAAPPAPQHHNYPSSAASPYGLGGGGGGGLPGGPYQSHTSPYSFAVQQHQQHPHHRVAPYPSYGNHESGAPVTNGVASGGFSQHAVPGSTGGGMGASPAYHSPAVAGMMSSGMASHGSANAAHQGSYGSHYSASVGPPGGPMAAAIPASSMGAPGYPSAPQYSTQLPLAGRHRVTTTLWEDEGTLCFQVDARGVCVARRHDNSMINGTKLLNVCGMSRGKRDGILKNEKERIVVKVGAMHLKGVWITFQRGKQLAEQNGIADVLYPLFEPNIQSFLYHPDNYPRTQAVMAAAQERQAARKSSGLGGSGPASGLDMGVGPTGTASAMLGGSSQDADYPGGPAGAWNAPHHGAIQQQAGQTQNKQQQHQYRHPVNNGASYISSAPVTASHSPAHHTHSGYNTPGSTMMQSHNSQQSSVPLPNHMGAMRASFTGNNGAAQNSLDRRHSNPLEAGGNPLDHPGRMDNPYAMSSHHSSIDNGLPSSASSSTNSNGPSTAATFQSLPGIGSVGQRRTFSAASFKRGYNDEDSIGSGGTGPPNGHSSSSYEGAPHPSSSSSGLGSTANDFYGPGGERSFKRPRESGISRGSGGGGRGQDDSYDTSGEYAGAAGGTGVSNGNGVEKRGSGPTA